MSTVLVTGGTGGLGSYLVPVLRRRGHTVRVLSRSPHGSSDDDISYRQGDVRTGQGLEPAADGVDAVIHAATSVQRRAKATEVDGTRNMLAASRASGAHFVYVSIVGVDQHRFPYYKAKWAAEQVVQGEGAQRWTIQRATQFHDLLVLFLGLPVFPRTKHMAFQPVDAGEVSERLVDLVEAGPSGRAPDLGGPAVIPVPDLAATYRRLTGKRPRLVPAPAIGFLGDFDRGRHLCPDHAEGTITWEQFLQRQADAPASEPEPRPSGRERSDLGRREQ